MYSPNAPLPNCSAMKTEKLRPHATQTDDSIRASFGDGAWSSRCRNRSTASISVISPARKNHAHTGTSRSTKLSRLAASMGAMGDADMQTSPVSAPTAQVQEVFPTRPTCMHAIRASSRTRDMSWTC